MRYFYSFYRKFVLSVSFWKKGDFVFEHTSIMVKWSLDMIYSLQFLSRGTSSLYYCSFFFNRYDIFLKVFTDFNFFLVFSVKRVKFGESFINWLMSFFSSFHKTQAFYSVSFYILLSCFFYLSTLRTIWHRSRNMMLTHPYVNKLSTNT